MGGRENPSAHVLSDGGGVVAGREPILSDGGGVVAGGENRPLRVSSDGGGWWEAERTPLLAF